MIRLRQLREEKGITQTELGHQIGYSQRSICNWEKAIAEPNIDNLKALASFFNVSIDYLVGYADEWENISEQVESKKMSSALAEDEKEIITLFRSLSPERQREAIVWLKTLQELDAEVAQKKKTS